MSLVFHRAEPSEMTQIQQKRTHNTRQITLDLWFHNPSNKAHSSFLIIPEVTPYPLLDGQLGPPARRFGCRTLRMQSWGCDRFARVDQDVRIEVCGHQARTVPGQRDGLNKVHAGIQVATDGVARRDVAGNCVEKIRMLCSRKTTKVAQLEVGDLETEAGMDTARTNRERYEEEMK